MKFVPNSVSRFAGRSLLKLNAKSPTILVVAGVAGFGVTAVMAAKASRKADPVLEQHRENRLQLESISESEEHERSQVVALYKDTAFELGKVYGPTIFVGVLSASSVLYGHKLLHGRHVASLLAYSGLQEQFASYRSRVAKTLGQQAERDIYEGAHGEWVEDPDHKGEYKLEARYDEEDQEATYLRPWFDETNDNCRMDPIGNYNFLSGTQAHANNLLQIRGHVFLNEVLKDLGMKQVPEGQVAGWLRTDAGGKDGFIDLGFMNGGDPHTQRFAAGQERTVRLNFNVDGNIFEKMLSDKYRY